MKVRIPADSTGICNVKNLGNKVNKLVFESFGYSDRGDILIYDERMMDVKNEIGKIKEYSKPTFLRKFTFEDIKKMTREFYEKNFKLHDVLVASKIDVQKAKNIRDYKYATEVLDNISKRVNPFDIPVGRVREVEGSYIHALRDFPNEKINKEHETIITGIYLGSDDNKFSEVEACTYGHEICHSLLYGKKGSISQSKNTELLSIFIENLIALELDESMKLLKTVECTRLMYLDNQINDLKDMYSECNRYRGLTMFKYFNLLLQQGTRFSEISLPSTYVYSTLQAENLFNKYFNADEETRNDMKREIQKIFDGRQTLEDMLSKYNITYENSLNPEIYSDICKRLLK